MKRTTLVLENDLFRQIKQEAARHGETLKEFVSGLLRKALATPKKTKPYKLNWKPVQANIKPGVDVADRNSLYEILEGRR